MDPNDPGSFWRDQAVDTSRVDIQCIRIYICENGCYLLPLQRMSRRCEGVGRENYFTSHFKSTNGDFESDGRIAHADAVFCASGRNNLLLKFLYHWPIIRQPSPFQDSFEPFHKSSFVPKVWPADMQLFRKARFSAEDGEFWLSAFKAPRWPW